MGVGALSFAGCASDDMKSMNDPMMHVNDERVGMETVYCNFSRCLTNFSSQAIKAMLLEMSVYPANINNRQNIALY